MSEWLVHVPVIMAAVVILGWLLHNWRKQRSYREWLYMMRRTMNLPDFQDHGDGWITCTCTNCYHRFLWWQTDDCICTKCGVHYHHTRELDTFDD